jgi:hypothetical protein
MFMHYRLKTNLSVVPLAKGVCRCTKVMCIGLCNAVERYVFSFVLQHLHIQVTNETQPWEDEDVIYMCLWQNICVLQELNPDPPSSCHILYLLLWSLYSKNSLQCCFHDIFVHMYKKLKTASCIYPYVFNARMKHSITEKESTWCVVREMVLDTEILHTLLVDVLCTWWISSYNPLLWQCT